MTPENPTEKGLIEAVQGVLLYRVGELPDKGYIRDNDAARHAIGEMVKALASARPQAAALVEPVAGSDAVAWMYDYRIAFRGGDSDWKIGCVSNAKPVNIRPHEPDYRNITALYAHPAAPPTHPEPWSSFPSEIGRLHLGERPNDDDERLCSEGHAIPAGHPLYWPQQISQYDDSDPVCLAHAINQAERDQQGALYTAVEPSPDERPAQSVGRGSHPYFTKDETGYSDADCIAVLLESYAKDRERDRLPKTAATLRKAIEIINLAQAVFTAPTPPPTEVAEDGEGVRESAVDVIKSAVDILDVAIDNWNTLYPHEPDEVLTDLQRRCVEVLAAPTKGAE